MLFSAPTTWYDEVQLTPLQLAKLREHITFNMASDLGTNTADVLYFSPAQSTNEAQSMKSAIPTATVTEISP